MRAIAEPELVLGMGTRQTEENFSRVHADAGQIPAEAVGSVEGDVHCLPSSHWARDVLHPTSLVLHNDVMSGRAQIQGGLLEQSIQRNRLLGVEHRSTKHKLAIRTSSMNALANFFHWLG